MPWSRRANISVCTVNQWALDFVGNRDRILKSKCLIKVIANFFQLAMKPTKREHEFAWDLNWRFVDMDMRIISLNWIPKSIHGKF